MAAFLMHLAAKLFNVPVPCKLPSAQALPASCGIVTLCIGPWFLLLTCSGQAGVLCKLGDTPVVE